MTADLRQALIDGLTDAVGFVGGALIGWQAGKVLGYDVLASGSADSRNVVGWILLLAGCGAGKWASLRWRARQAAKRGGAGAGAGADGGGGGGGTGATTGPKK
jgi:hypothetical protein